MLLVETRASVGEAVTDGTRLRLHSLSRTSNDPALPRGDRAVRCRGSPREGSLSFEHADPGWRPNLDSPALGASRRAYERLFGAAPIITAVHAWLETAVIGDKVPGLDMVSFGPQVEARHSPDERVNIPAVDRFWRLLAGVVDELSAP